MTVVDDEGRPTWVTTVEPEWDAEDRAMVQALMDIKADQCPGCGEPLSESLHVNGKPDPVYSAAFAVCVSCETREKAMNVISHRDDSIEKSGGKVFRAARHWVMRRLNALL